MFLIHIYTGAIEHLTSKTHWSLIVLRYKERRYSKTILQNLLFIATIFEFYPNTQCEI